MVESTIFGLTTGELGFMLWGLFCYIIGAVATKLELL
jgi:hypothetical protein